MLFATAKGQRVFVCRDCLNSDNKAAVFGQSWDANPYIRCIRDHAEMVPYRIISIRALIPQHHSGFNFLMSDFVISDYHEHTAVNRGKQAVFIFPKQKCGKIHGYFMLT